MTRRSMAKWLGILVGAKWLGVPDVIAAPAAAIQPVTPVPPGETGDPVANEFLKALANGQAVTVFYHGGATPGAMRRFSPQSVYRMRPGGPLYSTGICQLRGEVRTLRLERARLG